MAAGISGNDTEDTDENTLAISGTADLDVFESGGSHYLRGHKAAWESMEKAAKDMQGKAVELPDDNDTVEIERESLEDLLALVYMYRGDERVEHDEEMDEKFSVVHDAEEALEGI